MKPRRLELDHVAPPRRPRWIGYVVLAVSLGIAAILTQRYYDTQLALQRLTAAEGLTNVKRPAKAVPRAELDEQVKNADAIIRQLALPWGPLIERLEQATGTDVALLQLQPDAQQRLVRIMAEARDETAMVEYLRRLAEVKGFAYVHLLSHHVQQDEPQHPVQFSAQASFGALP